MGLYEKRLLQPDTFIHILIDIILLRTEKIIEIWSLPHCRLADVELIKLLISTCHIA